MVVFNFSDPAGLIWFLPLSQPIGPHTFISSLKRQPSDFPSSSSISLTGPFSFEKKKPNGSHLPLHRLPLTATAQPLHTRLLPTAADHHIRRLAPFSTSSPPTEGERRVGDLPDPAGSGPHESPVGDSPLHTEAQSPAAPLDILAAT